MASNVVDSSVAAMMKKAVTEKDSFYRDPQSVKGYEQRKLDRKKERNEKKRTLAQWYGFKSQPLTDEQKADLELLQYRNFVNKDTAHHNPKRTSSMDQTEFVEFGYFAGTGKNKRKRIKSFADEWLEESDELKALVKKRMKRNVVENRKARGRAAAASKRAQAKRSGKDGGKGSKRKRNSE